MHDQTARPNASTVRDVSVASTAMHAAGCPRSPGMVSLTCVGPRCGGSERGLLSGGDGSETGGNGGRRRRRWWNKTHLDFPLRFGPDRPHVRVDRIFCRAVVPRRDHLLHQVLRKRHQQVVHRQAEVSDRHRALLRLGGCHVRRRPGPPAPRGPGAGEARRSAHEQRERSEEASHAGREALWSRRTREERDALTANAKYKKAVKEEGGSRLPLPPLGPRADAPRAQR